MLNWHRSSSVSRAIWSFWLAVQLLNQCVRKGAERTCYLAVGCRASAWCVRATLDPDAADVRWRRSLLSSPLFLQHRLLVKNSRFIRVSCLRIRYHSLRWVHCCVQKTLACTLKAGTHQADFKELAATKASRRQRRTKKLRANTPHRLQPTAN